jgi:hypothetical protein
MFSRLAFEEQVSTIITSMIADWASDINFHSSIHQIAPQRMTIMSKLPDEMLYLIGAF